MFGKEKIEKVFEILGLKTKEDRQKLLFQTVIPEVEGELEYQTVLDNATTPNKEGQYEDARLERTIE